MEPQHQQINLFSNTPLPPKTKPDTLVMSQDALTQWKARICKHQQQVRETSPTQQGTLFDVAPAHCDPNEIDPLALQLQPMSFYRMPVDSPGDACLYFVVDCEASLVLYVGETGKSNQRWKGVHDCKQYVENYQNLHYRYQLKTAVNMTFWWNAPTDRKARQALELALIQRWRTPFNKENWQHWGQPFGK